MCWMEYCRNGYSEPQSAEQLLDEFFTLSDTAEDTREIIKSIVDFLVQIKLDLYPDDNRVIVNF